MKLKVQLSYSDYIQNQLYRSSRDKTIQGKRQKQWLLLTIGFLLMALYFWYLNDRFLFVFSLVFTLLTVLFFKKYFDFRYRKHYEKFILKNLKNRFGVTTEVEFTNEAILMNDQSGEGKINNDQVAFVSELNNYFFIKLNMGETLILPKSGLDVEKLKAHFMGLNFLVIDEMNWKWGDWNADKIPQIS